MWYEKFDFDADPYQRLDPFKIDLSRLSWNRDDLAAEREKLDHFIADVISGNRVGLIGYGAIGSGKTWLARILQKEIQSKQKDSIFIYTKVHKLEPTFAVIYKIAVESILSQIKIIQDAVSKKAGKDDLDGWKQAFGDEDLAKGLVNISKGGKSRAVAERWLLGNRISSGELDTLDIINPIDSDYKQYDMLKNMIFALSKLFPVVVLVIDELDNAPMKLASALSDSLRNMLDEFANNFALICLFTAQASEEWYERGYSEALKRRIDYVITLDSIKIENAPIFLRKHHSLYREEGKEVKDQLLPFSEDGVIAILKLMSVEKHFPGYFFPNCETITKTAAEENAKIPIDAQFVQTHRAKMPYQFTGETYRLDMDFRK